VDLDNSKKEKPTLLPLRLSSASEDTHHDIEQETLVGREVECTISLDSPHVSRYHAKIVISNNGAIIEDLNSSNGTFVNGRRIREKTSISLGDEIRFDKLAFRLTSRDSGTSDQTVMVSKITPMPSHALDPSPKEEVKKDEKAPPKPEVKPVPPAMPVEKKFPPELPQDEQPEEERTRALSAEQIHQAAAINEQMANFKDSGSGPRLVATSAPIRGKIFQLDTQTAEDSWPLGRANESALRIPVKSISRHHATLFKKNGLFSIRAENDKELLINGRSTVESMLKHNDHLQLGTIDFVFRLDEPSIRIKQSKEEPESNNTAWILGGFTLFFFLILAYIVLASG
jgi:pSer/pThr/pTyr-binding forkhead associated (FHA) protein